MADAPATRLMGLKNEALDVEHTMSHVKNSNTARRLPAQALLP